MKSDMSFAIAQSVCNGWDLEYVSDELAVLTAKRKNNNTQTHIVFAILSVISFGLFLPIWLIVALCMPGEARHTLTFSRDTSGNLIRKVD